MTDLHTLTTLTTGLPCRTDPDRWYSTDPAERHDAARQCHRCPLLLACMQYALAAGEEHGVWGGVDFGARADGCGSERGYRRHVRRKELACASCQAAHDEVVEADRRRRLAVEHEAGGTVRGYWMHRRLGEEACPVCRAALRRRSKQLRDEARRGRVRPRTAPAAPGTGEAGSAALAAVQPFARCA